MTKVTVVVTDRRMDRQMIFNVQLLLQGGGGQNYFLKFLVVTTDKTSLQLCESFPKIELYIYNALHVHICEKIAVNFRATLYRKGT